MDESAPEQVEQWLEQQTDRSLSRQRASADNAKLVATFVAGIAATLVATSFQVGPAGWLDRIGALALAATLYLTWLVIKKDTIREADHADIIKKGKGKMPEELLKELRKQMVSAVDGNEKVIDNILLWLRWQLLLAAITGVLAAVSLLR